MAVNSFLTDVEKNDLSAAYGVWIHDKKWQQHPNAHSAYTFDRFQDDWVRARSRTTTAPFTAIA